MKSFQKKNFGLGFSYILSCLHWGDIGFIVFKTEPSISSTLISKVSLEDTSMLENIFKKIIESVSYVKVI